MTSTLAALDSLLDGGANRILLNVDLRPVQGSRFQPTGFPDLGESTYTNPSTGQDDMLVESAQSMANRLETVCWDDASNDLVADLQGLPYVRARGATVDTSSILEAHRINSPYILSDKEFEETFKKEAGLGQGMVDRKRFAKALLKYDPNTLVHGVFMSKIKPGTARLERLLSAFVEAQNVQPAESGGVKIDRNDTSGKDAGGAAEGFGNVPYHRTEWVAERITAYFNIDLAELRGFGLGRAGERLILGLALYKVRGFLEQPMRFRTSCDLEVVNEDSALWTRRPEGFALPPMAELGSMMSEAIKGAVDDFVAPPCTEVQYDGGKKASAGDSGKE